MSALIFEYSYAWFPSSRNVRSVRCFHVSSVNNHVKAISITFAT